jgi:hypothetical protein
MRRSVAICETPQRPTLETGRRADDRHCPTPSGACATPFLPHLEHEETVAVPELVRIFDDQDWAQIDKRFRQGVSLRDLGWIAMWLLDDLDPVQAQFLRRQLPGPVLTFLIWCWGRSYQREASLAWDLAGVRR